MFYFQFSVSRRRQTPTINLDDDDDDDDECDSLDFDTCPPPSKRRSTRHTAKAFEDSLKQLKDMASDISSIKRNIDSLTTVSEATPVPLPILRHVEFPDSDVKFCTDNFDSLDSLTVHATVNDTVTDSQEVHGLPPSTTQLFSSSASTPTAGVIGSASGFSGFKTPHRQRWMTSMSNKGKGKGPTSCIKVTLAGRKPDGSAGTQKSQCFLNLTNEDANIPAITRMVRDIPGQHTDIVFSERSGHSRQFGNKW